MCRSLPLTFICFADDPSRGVTNSKVQYLSAVDHSIEGLHQFWDRCCEVPPMNVQQVNVISLEFLQRCLERHTKRFGAIMVKTYGQCMGFFGFMHPRPTCCRHS